jgi:hypothetical protein
MMTYLNPARRNTLVMDAAMKCARVIAAIIFLMAASLVGRSAVAQRGNAIDTLAAQMNQDLHNGRYAEGLALAQKRRPGPPAAGHRQHEFRRRAAQ